MESLIRRSSVWAEKEIVRLRTEIERVCKSLSRAEEECVHASSAARMYCERTTAAEARAEKADAKLAALKKDARACAEYIRPLWHEGYNRSNPLKEAADRILEATKEG